jgi:predicted Rossmann fold nucleotide-binding protein DprA/Smf involved in DNA uptake
MAYCAESYAAMLLCLSLSPNKEEYARPLSTAEYRDLTERVKQTSARRISALMNVDISGIMQLLSMTEEEAYRVFLLLSRAVQLSYAMEGFAEKGVRIVTEFDEEYPLRLSKRLGAAAPPVFYLYGDHEALARPSLGILGMSGIKTAAEVRASVDAVTRFARRAGYRVMTGGELGISRVTEGLVLPGDCELTTVLGGGLSEYIARPEMQALERAGRLVALSLEHPEALFTTAHAVARNKLLLALSEAAFLFNTDGKRGESDALRTRACDWFYAWDGYPANAPLIHKGAIPFHQLDAHSLKEMAARWKDSRVEQLDMFDLFDHTD